MPVLKYRDPSSGLWVALPGISLPSPGFARFKTQFTAGVAGSEVSVLFAAPSAGDFAGFTLAANSKDITCTIAGRYIINIDLPISPIGATVYIRQYRGGSNIFTALNQGSIVLAATAAGNYLISSLSTVLDLNVGDIINVNFVNQTNVVNVPSTSYSVGYIAAFGGPQGAQGPVGGNGQLGYAESTSVTGITTTPVNINTINFTLASSRKIGMHASGFLYKGAGDGNAIAVVQFNIDAGATAGRAQNMNLNTSANISFALHQRVQLAAGSHTIIVQVYNTASFVNVGTMDFSVDDMGP